MKGPPAATGRSPARATMLVVGGVIVIVVALVLVLTSGGGGKSTGQGSGAGQGTKTTTSTSNGTHQKQLSSHHSASAGAGAASPASTTVAVLNGTSTNGLAHSLSKDLQQSGYSQAAALNGTPPGSHASTVVEYASGHHAEAQGVASALSVTQVQPMETAVASLAGAATVVVIAGEDKAAALGASSGEASGAGASGAAG
jgi:LytR cell envelope-related transcriptional attenuator